MKNKIFAVITSVLVIALFVFAIITNDKYVTSDMTVIEINSNDITEINFQLDESSSNDSLYFYSNSTNINVYFDGYLVETFSNTVSSKKMYEIKLTDDITDVKIEQGVISGILSEITEVYIGQYSDLTIFLLTKDAVLLSITLLMFFTSIVIIILSFYFLFLRQRVPIFIGFAMFFIATSLWCLVQVDFIVILFDSNVLYNIHYYIIFSFSICAAFITMMLYKDRKYKVLGASVIFVFIAMPICSVIMSFFDIYLLEILNFIAMVLTILYFIGIIILTRVSTDKIHTKYTSIFSQSLAICCVGLAVEFANALFRQIIGPSGMYFAISLMFVYIFSIGRLVKEYIRKENDRNHLSEENARLSSSILLSQIKPHFLYNALNSISFLCKRDPKQADMAVIRFSRYLRQNMKCIESTELVDFASEMEHVRNYVYLEQIRFPKMEVVYELKYINFKVPPLCIQPIVENAVKHGVSKNTDGGYLIVKSFATSKHIIIEVSDNGPGFDTKVSIKGTGLSNISRRLKMILSADIEFGSVIGKGTVVRVRIPRKDVK